jgi:hypothetical protein
MSVVKMTEFLFTVSGNGWGEKSLRYKKAQQKKKNFYFILSSFFYRYYYYSTMSTHEYEASSPVPSPLEFQRGMLPSYTNWIEIIILISF